ncbi:hypothetical protein DL93DRAFT_2171545 [Clavulina sp. PMI_390]|nr:hypothetical protein DL93DRAFT_2171545 [Clavulina sp. PMI_390]
MKTTVASSKRQDIVILAPRHGAAPLPSPKVLRMARLLAKKKGKKLVLPPAKAAQPKAFDDEMESSSDWNSLLLTARAQRGPQWDVTSQQFMVDRGSDIYYNFTPLMEVHKDKSEPPPPAPEPSSQPPPQHINMMPDQMRNPGMHMPPQGYPGQGGMGGMPGGPGYPGYPPQPGQFPPGAYPPQNGMSHMHGGPPQQMHGISPPNMQGYPQDVYIPPERNPRRATRANGPQGMYRT